MERAATVGGLILLTGSVLPLQSGLLAAMYVTVGLVLLTTWRRTIKVALTNWPLVVLVGVAILSTGWSIQPSTTITNAAGVLGASLFGLMLSVRYSTKQWVELVAVSMILTAAISLVVVILWPSVGIMSGLHDGAWRGVYVHKNILGRLMALGVVACFFWSARGTLTRILRLTGIVLCCLLLALSFSRTAWSITVIGMTVSAFVGLLRIRSRLILPGSLVVGAAFVASLYLLLLAIEPILLLLGRDITLTGRTVVWAAMAGAIITRPFAGFGFGAFWNNPSVAAVLGIPVTGFLPSHAHNGWIELALDLGLMGVVLLGVSYLLVLAKAVRAYRTDNTSEVRFMLVLLFALLALSVVESTLFRENNVFWVLYCAIAFSLGALRTEQLAVARHK